MGDASGLWPGISRCCISGLACAWVGCYDGVSRGDKRFGGAVGPGQRTGEQERSLDMSRMMMRSIEGICCMCHVAGPRIAMTVEGSVIR